MKVKKQIFVLFLTMLVGIPILSAQNKKEQKAEVVKKIIISRDYRISVDTYIHPRRDPILLDEFDNSIEIRNDSIFSNLLYLEQADIPYGRRGAELFFQAPLKKYTMDIDKKKNVHIKFLANTTIGNCNFYIKVYPNGSASIYITLQQGKSANFLGKLNMRGEETESL
ncbi:DUF4251 domain-containing protein [Bacteroides sp. AN502(2024)]|uniref:DUF4251 domain-containing protein n=1 Tax=Bacteroides sp. AN502(2024) TaxID=3160599 RepID=UPI0035120F6D